MPGIVLDAGAMTPRIYPSGVTVCVCVCMYVCVSMSRAHTCVGGLGRCGQGTNYNEIKKGTAFLEWCWNSELAIPGLEHCWGRNGFLEEVSVGARESWQSRVG